MIVIASLLRLFPASVGILARLDVSMLQPFVLAAVSTLRRQQGPTMRPPWESERSSAPPDLGKPDPRARIWRHTWCRREFKIQLAML